MIPDHEEMVANILAVYDKATPVDLAEGEVWYATARDFAIGLAAFTGYPLPAVCGVIAALSPQRSWGENQRAAHALCTGRPVRGLTRNTEKAKRILAGETPESVFTPPNPRRITGNKVRNFYRNLSNNTYAITIDRHAACIAGLCEKDIDRKDAYHNISYAYRRAAHLRNIEASTMQAVTWVTWRALKHPKNRGAFNG